MLIKLGVTIQHLSRAARRALNTVDNVFKKNGEEPVITSTNEGHHMPSSLHYCNNAFDLRIPKNNCSKIVDEIRQQLGNKFDIIGEMDHIHVEFDPKKK